nr:hypothetical protein [Tanacetum cinerariifolium]
MDEEEVDKLNYLNKDIVEQENEVRLDEDDILPDVADPNTIMEEVTGSRMLLHEDTKSYTWLLNAFMTAFSHEPTMIVTDQDGAMKRAIEAIFKKAKHRLSMWHIMQKIPSKTGSHEINV